MEVRELSESEPGSEGARNLRIEREMECIWVISRDELATVKVALAFASCQEGWAAEGIKTETLNKRIRQLVDAGALEYVDKKKTSARLTPIGKQRLASYLAKGRSSNAWKFRNAIHQLRERT